MAALTKDSPQQQGRASSSGEVAFLMIPIANGVTIYQGAKVGINSGGYLAPMANSSALIYVGQSLSPKTTGTSNGSASIKVEPRAGMFLERFTGNSTPAQATWVGVHVFFMDDSGLVDLVATATAAQIAGRCLAIDGDATTVIVDVTDRSALAVT